MRKSDSATRDWTLADASIGARQRVTGLSSAVAVELVRHGITAGCTVVVDAVAPFGGPIIVRVGRARIAIPRATAAHVSVEPVAVDAHP